MASSTAAPSPPAGASSDVLHAKLRAAVSNDAKQRFFPASKQWAAAAQLSAPLYGEDSLVAAFAKLKQSVSLRAQAALRGVEATAASERRADAETLTLGVLPLLGRRMDTQTLLPGRCTAAERACYAVCVEATLHHSNARACTATQLRLFSTGVGYATACHAATNLLRCCEEATLSPPDEKLAHAFVLRLVDCMLPAAASLGGLTLGEEIRLASRLCKLFRTHRDEPFWATLHAKWTSSATAAMRHQRNLHDVSSLVRALRREASARQRADVAEVGLKRCGLHSCAKEEVAVRELQSCSACRAIRYCCDAHHADDWPAHRPVCRATTAAAAGHAPA